MYIHITFVFLQAVFCSQKTNHETWQKQVSRQVLGIGGKFFQWSFHPGWLLLSYCWWFRNPANSSPEIYTNGMLKKNQPQLVNLPDFWLPSTVRPGWQSKNRKQLRCHRECQVRKMEVLNLIRLFFWGGGFPYIRLTYNLHRFLVPPF